MWPLLYIYVWPKHRLGLYRTFLGVLQRGLALGGGARARPDAADRSAGTSTRWSRRLGVTLFTRSQHGLAADGAALELRHLRGGARRTAASLLRVASGQRDGVRGAVRVIGQRDDRRRSAAADPRAPARAVPARPIELVLSNRDGGPAAPRGRHRGAHVRPTRRAARTPHRTDRGRPARAPAVPRRHGTPRKTADLAGHALIGFDQMTAYLRSASKSLQTDPRRLHDAHRQRLHARR